MLGGQTMPEWVLWVLFVVVLLPMAALCLALIYALMLIAHMETKHLYSVARHGASVACKRKRRPTLKCKGCSTSGDDSCKGTPFEHHRPTSVKFGR